jgi:hypothetical protein
MEISLSTSLNLATIAKRFSAMAHPDGRHLDCPPSLSEHCGHGPIFIAQGSVANDPTSDMVLGADDLA